jgi:transposase
MADFFWFSNIQWARIEPLLPVNVKGAKCVDDRRVLSGIIHVLQSGGRWGHCPPVYGPKKTLYNRFLRWAERGIWEGIFSSLAGAGTFPTDCSSTAPASKHTGLPEAQKGGLG